MTQVMSPSKRKVTYWDGEKKRFVTERLCDLPYRTYRRLSREDQEIIDFAVKNWTNHYNVLVNGGYGWDMVQRNMSRPFAIRKAKQWANVPGVRFVGIVSMWSMREGFLDEEDIELI